MKELINRGIFGIIFLLFVFTPYYLDLVNQTNLFNLVLFTFSVFGTYEIFKMGEQTPYKSNLLFPGLLLNLAIFLPVLVETINGIYPNIPSLGIWKWIYSNNVVSVLWFVWVLLIVLFTWLIFRKEHVKGLFKFPLVLSTVYVILPLFLLAASMTQHDVFVKQLLLVVLLPIYLNDTLAYVSGRLFGKHKMFPTVSPKKTWEGFLGGLLGAAIVMLILLSIRANDHTTFDQYIALALISIAASVLSTLGDLFESKLKRSAEVKDSGNILPGHGGVLDRIDAMLFTAPTLYVLITYIL